MRKAAFLVMAMAISDVSAQQGPTTGYAPDGIRLEHVAEMFRLKGREIHGDLRPRSASRLAIVPNTTHVTLMQRVSLIVPMVNDFLDAGP